MMRLEFASHARRPAVVLAGMIVVLLTATVIVTAVTAQNTVTRPTVDPNIARLPPVKQTVYALGQTKTAEYASAHPEYAKSPLSVLPPTATPSLGIHVNALQNPWNPKQPADYIWRGYINGELVTVWTGSAVDFGAGGAVKTQQGYIGVAVGLKLGADADYHEYLTPTKHGGLKITAVNGTMVSLVAEDGTPYTFNLDTRTFS